MKKAASRTADIMQATDFVIYLGWLGDLDSNQD
jgi:hypothetical protein